MRITFFIIVGLFVAALFFGLKKTHQVPAKPMAPTITQSPPTEKPAPSPQPTAATPSVPPTNMPAQPLHPVPAEVQKELEKVKARIKNGDFQNLPDPTGQIYGGKKLIETATATEASAKELLNRMENCITNLNAQKGIPEPMRNQMQGLCLQTAESIAKKYPSLQAEYEKIARRKAGQGAVDAAKVLSQGGS